MMYLITAWKSSDCRLFSHFACVVISLRCFAQFTPSLKISCMKLLFDLYDHIMTDDILTYLYIYTYIHMLCLQVNLCIYIDIYMYIYVYMVYILIILILKSRN